MSTIIELRSSLFSLQFFNIRKRSCFLTLLFCSELTAEGDRLALLWTLVDIVNLFLPKLPVPLLATGTNQVQISRNPIAKDDEEAVAAIRLYAFS